MTLDQFKNEMLNAGSVAKTDGGYLGECVSLINQYLSKTQGINAGAWGHAKDWANSGNPIRNWYDQVNDTPRAGDIVVWGSNFGGGYGHIGISLGNGQLLDQNGRRPRGVAVGSIYPGYIAVLRRKGTNQQGDTSDMIKNTDTAPVRVISSEVKGWPFDAVHAGQFDQREMQAWTGKDWHRFIMEAWAESEPWRNMRNQKLANYDNLVNQVNDLKANPTKAELQAVIDQLNSSNNKVVELEKKLAEAPTGNPDDIVVSRGFWNRLFDKIKSIIGGK